MAPVETDENVLFIRQTPSLNRFIYFLKDCAAEDSIDEAGLAEVKHLMQPDEKHIFHLVLSACLDDKEYLAVLNNNAEDMFSSVSTVLDEDETERLSKGSYMDIVFGLELVEHCLCMILAAPGSQVMQDVSKALTKQISQPEVAASININLFETILTSFAKLSGLNDASSGEFYVKCFKDVLGNFIKVQCTKAKLKTATIVRLIGASLLQEDDYQNSTEISVLLQEWEFDKVPKYITKHKSSKVYEIIFGCQSRTWNQTTNKHVIWKLETVLGVLLSSTSDSEYESIEISLESEKMSLSVYLGGCAYLIQRILEKHRDTVKSSELPNTLKFVQSFIKKKPKMKQEEVIGQILSFAQFCEEMARHGNRDIYRRDWISRFLGYTSEEIIGMSEGNATIEGFIFNAELDLVIECIKKLRDVDPALLDQSRKNLILKLLTHERASSSDNDKFIKEMYQTGVNKKLELETFNFDLHKLTLQLRSVEFETDPERLAMHQNSVLTICLQNPIVAIARILEHSIRTEHFRALGFARPLFHLPVVLPDKNNESQEEMLESEKENQLPPVLMIYCFNKVLKSFPDYPNVIYECLAESMELLFSQTIISQRDLFVVIKHSIIKLINAHHSVALSKVVGESFLLENLIDLVAEPSMLKEIALFVVNLNRFFCLYTNSKTAVDALKIRHFLVRIICKLQLTLPDLTFEISKATEEEIEDLNLFDQGLAYVRFERSRPVVEKMLTNVTNSLSLKEFIESCLVPWILNCCELQWSILIEFVFSVILSSASKLHRIKNAKKLYLLNETLLFVYCSSREINVTDAFLHTLKFYGVVVDKIQKQFGENDWYDLFDTLLTIGIEMSRPRGEKKCSAYVEIPGLHQVLSLMLSKIDSISNSNFTFSGCEQLVSKAGKFPQLHAKCEPVRWLIYQKLNEILQTSCSA